MLHTMPMASNLVFYLQPVPVVEDLVRAPSGAAGPPTPAAAEVETFYHLLMPAAIVLALLVDQPL